MAGVSCLMLSIMWCCTLRFFFKTHPQRHYYDDHNYRLPQKANSGYIVCLFVFSCSLFGGITLVLIHDIIILCRLFDPPVQFLLSQYTYYIYSLTAIMSIIMFLFLCCNCCCYSCYGKRNAGSIC